MALTGADGAGFFGGLGSTMIDYTFDVGGATGAAAAGLKAISLKEMLSRPMDAFPQLERNLASNWQAILIGSFFTAASWKVLRRVLRQPVNRINRDLFGKRGIIGNVGFKL